MRERGHQEGGEVARGGGSDSAVGKSTLTEGLVQRQGDGAVTPRAETALGQAAGSAGSALPAPLRGRLEGSLGVDLGGVQVHAGGASADAADAIGARAYTTGQDIHFGAGQLDYGSEAGQHLVAHEVAHTVQQGASGGTPQRSPIISQPGDAAEHEADAAADAFVAGRAAPALSRAPSAIHRQPVPQPQPQPQPQGQGQGQQQPGPPPAVPTAGHAHTITDGESALRGGPPGFKGTGKNIPVGTRVVDLQEQTVGKITYVEVEELAADGKRTPLGWTTKSNFGDQQYAQATASFVYVAPMQPRKDFADTLPLMVFAPAPLDPTKPTDIVLFCHGDVADYSQSNHDNMNPENPAIGAHMAGARAGAGPQVIVIAPQVNDWARGYSKSPWQTLHAGDFQTMVDLSLRNLAVDLGLGTPIKKGQYSIAGHSGGGKGLGQAALDLDQDKDAAGVTDVTLQEAGYGGGEDKAGKPDHDGGFVESFQMVREWLIKGNAGKILRVVTKENSAGANTRHAIENQPQWKDKDGKWHGDDASRVPALSLTGLRHAIAAKTGWTADEVKGAGGGTAPRAGAGGMVLTQELVIKRDNGTVQGTVYVFFMGTPPSSAAGKFDPHFGVRDDVMAANVKDRHKGDDFGK